MDDKGSKQTTGDYAVERFADAVEALVPGFGGSDERLGLAVSGGPDSLALLLLAHASWPKRIAAATVDHRLRPDAADEARYVAAICAGRGIPHRTLTPDAPITGNIQSAARAARYALLDGWMDAEGIALLATGHHADDQLETMLMRLLRGSGLDGLSGIRARRGRIIRPLLDFTKAELEAIVATAGLTPVDDPGNRDPAFDRARIRAALEQLAEIDPRRANMSAKALADTRDAIDWMVERLAAERISGDEEEVRFDTGGLPHEIERRLVMRCLRMIDPEIAPRGEQLEAVLAALKRHDRTTIGNLVCIGGKCWVFSSAPPRQ